jgi:hypothetical protein
MTTDGSTQVTEASRNPLEGLRHCQSDAVGVVRAAGENRLVAIRPIAAGERLFRIEGVETSRPTRYSLQVGDNLHIDLGSGHSAEEILDRYFWRFMNHSCEPNAAIREREVISLRNIPPWEAVTYNYNTTEWEMAEPFICGCGSGQCLGRIQGLKHLTPAQRERLGAVPPHLSRRALENRD